MFSLNLRQKYNNQKKENEFLSSSETVQLCTMVLMLLIQMYHLI